MLICCPALRHKVCKNLKVFKEYEKKKSKNNVFPCWAVKPEAMGSPQGVTAPWQGLSTQLGQTVAPPLVFIALRSFSFMAFLLLSEGEHLHSFMSRMTLPQKQRVSLHTAAKLRR